jgi:uncharacterized PurR-regulated membrane protein YhhQ (DUF165 family)
MRLPTPQFWSSYSTDFILTMKPVFKTTSVGIISIIAGQFINIYIISKLRVFLRGRYFALRSMTSSIIGDTITIVVALSLDFSRNTGANHIIVIILSELFIMYALAIILSIPGTFITYYLRKVEGPIQDNCVVNFNPFSLKTD